MATTQQRTTLPVLDFPMSSSSRTQQPQRQRQPQRQPQPQQHPSDQDFLKRHPNDHHSKKQLDDRTNTATSTTTEVVDKENSVNGRPFQSRSRTTSTSTSTGSTTFGGSTVAMTQTIARRSHAEDTKLPNRHTALVVHPYQTPKQPKGDGYARSSTTTTTTTATGSIIEPMSTTTNNNTTTPYSLLSMEMNRFREPSNNKGRNDTGRSDARNYYDDDDDDDVSLLCSPIVQQESLLLPVDPKRNRQRILPTNLSSPPERIPINENNMMSASSDDNHQIAIFHTSKEPLPLKDNASSTASSAVLPVATSAATIIKNAPPTTQAKSTIEFSGLSRPPFTARANGILPTRDVILKSNKTEDAKHRQQQQQHQPVKATRSPTKIIHRPFPPPITTTIITNPPNDLVHVTSVNTKNTTDGNQSTKSTRFAMFLESPAVQPTTAISTSTKINNLTCSRLLQPQHERTPAALVSRNTSAMSQQSTNGKKGICMDLSDIFFDAASKTSSVQKSLPRQASSPNSLSEKTNIITKNGMNRDQYDIHETDDQQWAEKQVEMFTKWMNYLFYPSEDQQLSVTDDKPSSTSALRTLVVHQRMAQGRAMAHTLFHGTDMQRVRDIMCHEIGRNKIALRPDRDDLYANLDHRNMILSILLSYSTPWLRLGLETMFHTVISPETPTLFSPNPNHRKRDGMSKGKEQSKGVLPLSRLKLTLRNFIIHNILSDDKILAKYTGGKCKVPSGPFEDRYRAELRTVVTYRLLVLIIFLDRAKMSNVLDQAPNLFTSTSIVKSTRDVLLYICRNFLKAEGDFTKHLSRLGVKVQYEQEAVDELDFTISNLRVDLNDGVRIARMTELLTGAILLPKLRLPAVSRMQKLYNVKLAIDHLVKAGVPVSDAVAPYHIVDGHREMVLKLLWSVVAHCCLQALLSVEQVEEEIARIQRYHGLPQSQLVRRDQYDADADLRQVLMRWCNLICTRFGRNVDDFTRSFSDGKAICFLIHYYHPTLIGLKDIRMTSQDVLAKYSCPERLRINERSNGILANSRMANLGGIPEVIPICDTTHPPEEKTMVLCLTFLCSRLITSSVEIRACLIIQNCYRNYRERLLYMYKVAAGKKILSAWRANKVQYFMALKRRYQLSVKVIEQFITANKDTIYTLRLRRHDQQKATTAAITIQKTYRGFNAFKQVEEVVVKIKLVIVLQSIWRQKLARRNVLILLLRNDAALHIQRAWRTYQLQDYKKNEAAQRIQRIYRGYCGRVQYVIDILDIIAVQSCGRRMIALRNYNHIRETSSNEQRAAATVIQSFWRMTRARWIFEQMKYSIYQHSAATVIESMFRKWIALRVLRQLQYDAVICRNVIQIQSIWRSFSCRMVLNRLRANRRCMIAAISIQATARQYLAHARLSKLKRNANNVKCAGFIQAFWRGRRSRSRLVTMQYAATLIQAAMRRNATTREIHLQQVCAFIIQNKWRQLAAIKSFRFKTFAIILAQSICRRFLAKATCIHKKSAILKIQCNWRNRTARIHLQTLKHIYVFKNNAAVVVQGIWRGFSIKNTFKLVKRDAVVVQSTYRRFRACQRFIKMKHSTITAQSVVRQFLARKLRHRLQAYKIETEQKQERAAFLLQTIFRGFIVRCILRRRSWSAIDIQRFVRGAMVKNEFRMTVCKIVKVQSSVRRWFTVRLVSRMNDAIVRIQCLTRKFFARCEFRNLVHYKHRVISELHAVSTIQRLYRGMAGRQVAVQEASARMIQKTWRCYTIHVEYMLSILAAIDIQATMRRFLAETVFERRYSAVIKIQSFSRLSLTNIMLGRQTHCATTLQSFARMVLDRNALARKKILRKSAALIQSFFRGYVCRSSYRVGRTAVMTLQRFVRGFLVRLQLETEAFASIEIQRIWLGFVAREFFAWNILAAITLQSYFRGVLARSLSQKKRNTQIADRCLIEQSAIIIQLHYRKYCHNVKVTSASTKIQKAAKCFIYKKNFGKVRQGILRMQCLARGFITRRKRSKKVIVQARRIGTVSQKALAAPKMQLGRRTADALEVLVNSKSLAEIMDAVYVLEVSTRLSEVCCMKFADAKAPDILFSLIQTCNRSLPHIKLLHCILLTMSNVARLDKLVSTMATLIGIEVFLDLVQMFRDKDFVFCLVVSLLDRIVRSDVQEIVPLISRENLKRLKGVRDLCVRKHSVSGSDLLNQRRMSLEGSLHTVQMMNHSGPNKKVSLQVVAGPPDVHKSIRQLQRIIRLIEQNSNNKADRNSQM